MAKPFSFFRMAGEYGGNFSDLFHFYDVNNFFMLFKMKSLADNKAQMIGFVPEFFMKLWDPEK